MYFIRNFTDIGCNQQKNHKYGFAEKYFFSSHGTTLAQNFPKLAQLCDLHGKSPIEGLTGADCRQAACNGGAFLPDGNGKADGALKSGRLYFP